jgi:adenylate cyclase class 2
VADHVESEIKLRMSDPDASRAALVRLGARVVRDRHFEDNLLLDDEAGSLRTRGSALRVRRAGTDGILTYKGPREGDPSVKTRREIETGVADAEATRAVLEALGYRVFFRYQKFRETWSWSDVEIVLDETPVGTFLEIEGPVESIHRAAGALGFSREAYLTASYAALFVEAGGRGDMVFP